MKFNFSLFGEMYKQLAMKREINNNPFLDTYYIHMYTLKRPLFTNIHIYIYNDTMLSFRSAEFSLKSILNAKQHFFEVKETAL